MTSVGEIVAVLTMNAASFMAGTKAAESSLKSLESQSGSAHGAVSKVGTASDGVGAKLSGLKDGVGDVTSKFSSMIGPLAAVSAGIGGLAEIKGSIDAFSDLAKQTGALSRITGDSVENSSRMIFAFKEKGVAAETVTKSVGKLEKALQGVTDAEDGGMMPAGKSMVKLINDLGIHMEDATGKTRPMNDVVLDLADQFKKLGPGPEATALALKLFGKAGADMLPALLLGKKGMQELEEESDKLGHTLNKQEMDSFKKNSLATKEWKAALEGIQIQLGAVLMPILAKFAELGVVIAVALNQKLVPAIQFVGDIIDNKLLPAFLKFMNNQAIPMIQQLAGLLMDKIVPAFMAFADVVADKLTGPLERFSQLIGGKEEMLKALAIVIGITLAAAVLVYATNMAIAAVATVIAAAPMYLLIAAAALLAAGVYLLIDNWDRIIAEYPKVGDATGKLKELFLAFVDWLKGPFWDGIQAVYNAVSEWVGKAIAWVQEHWDEIKAPFVAFGEWVGSTYVPFWVKVYSTVYDNVKKAIDWVVDNWDTIKAPFVAFGEWVGSTYIPFWVKVYSTVYDNVKKAIDFVVDNWDKVSDAFDTSWSVISTAVSNIVGAIQSIIDKADDLINGAGDGIGHVMTIASDAFVGFKNMVMGPINTVTGAIQALIDLAGRVGSAIDGALHAGGDLNPLNWGGNATGTSNWGGGLTMVGEGGPELLNLPRGAQVMSTGTTQALLSDASNRARAGGGGDGGAGGVQFSGEIHIHEAAPDGGASALDFLGYQALSNFRRRGLVS